MNRGILLLSSSRTESRPKISSHINTKCENGYTSYTNVISKATRGKFRVVFYFFNFFFRYSRRHFFFKSSACTTHTNSVRAPFIIVARCCYLFNRTRLFRKTVINLIIYRRRREKKKCKEFRFAKPTWTIEM